MPARRLRTVSQSPILQAIIEGLPNDLTGELDKADRVDCLSRIESALTITQLMHAIRLTHVAVSTLRRNNLLVQMDKSRWHRNWNCPRCGHRWGAHDDSRTCPDMSSFDSNDV